MMDLSPKMLCDSGLQTLSYRLAIVFYLLIVVLGSIPGARADLGEYAPGVVLHLLAYAVLGFLLFVGSRGEGFERAVNSVLTVMAMGAFDEFVQGFFPYRTASLADWMLDVAAATGAAATMSVIWPRLVGRP